MVGGVVGDLQVTSFNFNVPLLSSWAKASPATIVIIDYRLFSGIITSSELAAFGVDTM